MKAMWILSCVNQFMKISPGVEVNGDFSAIGEV